MNALEAIKDNLTTACAQVLEQRLTSDTFSGSLSAEEFQQLCQLAELPPIELMHQLLPLVVEYAHAPISSFHVAAIARGLSGAIYFGANLEFDGSQLGQSIHAEQAAITHAWMKGEEGITDIVISAPPCGHCRQFMNELSTSSQLQVHVTDHPSYSLNHILPHHFGPIDLNVKHPFLVPNNHQYPLNSNNDLKIKAVEALNKSYTPYTNSPSGVCLQTHSGACFVGAYVENAAYNPTLSPFHVAIVQLRLNGYKLSDIAKVVLAEIKQPVCQQYQLIHMLIKTIHAEIELTHITV